MSGDGAREPAKHHAGDAWQTLSIPRGGSAVFDVAKDGEGYRVDLAENPEHDATG